MRTYAIPTPTKVANKIAVVIVVYNPTTKERDELKYTLKCHERFRGTNVPYDIILVDNSSPVKYKPRGYTHMTRENTGFSFGGYIAAWKKFGSKYDFYLFQEQDIAPCKPGWLNQLIIDWYSDKEVRIVGNSLETAGHTHEVKCVYPEQTHNLCGAFFFTTPEALEENEPELVYYQGRKEAVWNELNFTKKFVDNGYALGFYGHKTDMVTTFFNSSHIRYYTINEEDIPGTITPLITIHAKKRFPIIRKYLEFYGL